MASTNLSPINSTDIIFENNHHAATISEKLQSFYKENEFFDTVLIAGSNCVNIQGHRVLLCALSEYFLEIFRGDQTASMGNVVELKEIDASSLKLIIDFMYAGYIKLSPETVEGVLRTASFLKMKTLVNGCCNLIENIINSSNSLKWFRLAKELNLPKLKANAADYIYTHFDEQLKKKEFLELSESELKDLLFRNNAYRDVEDSVFLGMMAWINYDKLNRDHLTFQFLSMVHFQALKPKFIIQNRKLVSRTVEIDELICSWLQWHLTPETNGNNQKNYTLMHRLKNKLAVVQVSMNDIIYIDTYNPKVNAWSTEIETSGPIKKGNYSITVVNDSYLVLFGLAEDPDLTNKIPCLNLRNLKWTELPPFHNYGGTIQLVKLDRCLCVFNYRSDGQSCIYIYSFFTQVWRQVQKNYRLRLSEFTQITSHNRVLYLLDFSEGILLCYEIPSNKWTRKKIDSEPLKKFGFVAIEGFLYVIGGCYKNIRVSNTMKRYNLCDESWCEMKPMPRACCDMKTTVVDKKIIIVDDFKIIHEYNYEKDTWNTIYFSVKIAKPRCFNVFTYNTE